MRITTVGLDADDTLWHNETIFRLTQDRMRDLLADVADEPVFHATLAAVEKRNLRLYGYGVKGFTLSMIETAMELTDGAPSGRVIADILAAGREMLGHPVEPLPGVDDALHELSESYRLVLITKGDLLHQTSKLERSGLRDHFRFVEVVSEKSPAVYSAILSRHGIEPERFLMIGNSVRSDVLPVIAAGGWAAHVPAELTWAHEHAVLPRDARSRCFEVTTLDRLADVIDAIERGQLAVRKSPSRRAAAGAGRRRPGAGSRRS
jgi:putative hydrolase of the HAD superfamily